MKMNSLTDMDFIRKVSEASQAGVKIDLIVRGICCILPEIPGRTENVRVTSIVGRYLEHPRVFVFGTGDDAKVYIGSADMMTRNTEKRVEVACPIFDPKIRKETDARSECNALRQCESQKNVERRYIQEKSTGRKESERTGDVYERSSECKETVIFDT